MAIGNREVTDLPLLSAVNGSDLYVVKADQDYRAKVGGPNGLAYLDTTGRLAAEFLQPNLATFDPSTKLDTASFTWAALPGKPTIFPSDWANVAGKPSFHAVATSGNYNDLINKPTSMAPTAHTHAAGDITSGVMAVARLGSGTPTTATFLRGDGTWATVPATTSIDWANITSKPATFPPSAHTHAAGDVTSGVFDVARIPDLAQSKVTGLTSALSGKVNKAGDAMTGPLTLTSGATVRILDTNGAQPNLELGAGYADGADRNAYIANRWSDGFIELFAAAGTHRLRVGPGGPKYNDQGVWHAGNFNPATKVDSSGSSYFSSNANAINGYSVGTMASPTTNTPDGSWTSIINVVTPDGSWGFQVAHPWFSDELYYRNVNDGSRGAYRRLYHSGNFDPATKVNNGGSVATITKLTQAAYDALGTKDANTLYVIVG